MNAHLVGQKFQSYGYNFTVNKKYVESEDMH